MRLLFGPYEPDKPPFLHKGLIAASNVYAGAQGYRPVGQFVPLADPLPAQPLGASSFVSSAGITTIIAGTRDSLYRIALGAWAPITGSYAVTMVDDDRWRFAQFGGLAIATNGKDAIVKIDLTTFAAAPLGGTPPTLKMLTVVKDFLVGGVANGVVNMVQWSGINDAESWTVGLDQCDYQIIPSGGEVTGLIGGEYGLVLQRGRVSRMTYIGDNLVFQFDEISNNVGCVSPHSVIQAGQMGFWLSDNGFMMWDGATIKPIGQERVDRTFAALYKRKDWPKMSTSVDLVNNLVAWSMIDHMFVYNWVLNRWSVIDQAASIVFSGFGRTFSLEDIGALYPDLETVPYSLDDPIWKGGNPLFYLFDSSYRMGTFSGSPMAATLGLGDLEMAAGRDARISLVKPLTDAPDGVTLSIVSRERLAGTLAPNSYTGIMGNGDMPVREAGRYSRMTMTIAAGTPWTYAEGVDVTVKAGARH